MASFIVVLLCALSGQVQGVSDKPLLKAKVSLTESEAQFESRIASGASLDNAKAGTTTVTLNTTVGQCDWRVDPNCWTDIVWNYLKQQEQYNSACLSKELEAKRSLDGLLALVNQAARETADQNATIHTALKEMWRAIEERNKAEAEYNKSMITCHEEQETARRNQLLPFYMELQELAHIADPTFRSGVSTTENLATAEATTAANAVEDSLTGGTSFIEVESTLDSGSLDTSSLQSAGQETCRQFASFVETAVDKHKELHHLKHISKDDCEASRVNLERNFTYAYLAIAGLYDQKNQEIANNTYECVERALAPLRTQTNLSNGIINASTKKTFAARAIITVLVPILQDLDLAELNLWQGVDVLNTTCKNTEAAAAAAVPPTEPRTLQLMGNMDVIRNDIENLGPCAGQNTFTLGPKTWNPDEGWWKGRLVPEFVYPKEGLVHPLVGLNESFSMEFVITDGNPVQGYTRGYGFDNMDNEEDAPYNGVSASGEQPWERAYTEYKGGS